MCVMNKNHALSNVSQKIWNKKFINIFTMNVILSMGQFMMNTLLPKYVEHLGATATIVGMVSGIFAVTALGVRPIVGPATSYFRKNRLLAATIGLILLSFIIYGFAGNIPMIIIGRLLHGMGMGFLAPITLALASNTLPSDKMASGIGVFSLAQAISTAVGPTVGLKLQNNLGYNKTFFILAALMCVVLVLSLRLETDEPNRAEGFKISLYNMIDLDVIVPAFIMFFLGGTYSCIGTFIVIYGEACGVKEIGLFFTTYAVCLLFTRPFSGKISDKYGMDKIMIPGIIIFALSFFIIGFSHSLPMFILAGVFSAFGYGICQPSMQTLCMRLVPKERRSVASNTSYIGQDTGILIIPTLAGSIVTFVQNTGGDKIYGYAVMYRVMIIPILIGLIIFLVRRKELIAKCKEL